MFSNKFVSLFILYRVSLFLKKYITRIDGVFVAVTINIISAKSQISAIPFCKPCHVFTNPEIRLT